MAEQLVIKINGDIKNYQESLKEIKSQTSNLQEGLNSIAKKSALAFAALSGAVLGSVAAYRVQEQAEIRTRQTIKATGGAAGVTAEEIFKMAGALQEMTTFGDEAIIAGQNMLLTFKNIGKDVFPRTTEVMLDMAEAMGTDLKSTAIQLGKALNDPKVGLTALQRVGITFNEQQKDQIKLMQETGDIASAQAIILKELESQFGGVAKASAEGTGELIQLKNIVGDLVEDFGKKFLPSILNITRPLKQFFLEFRENDALIESIVNVTKWGLAVTGTIAALTTAGSLVLGLSAAIGALTIAFAPATLAASSFWVAVTGPIGIAVAGIGLVTAGVIALWNAMSQTEPIERLKEINQLLEEKNKALEHNLKIAEELGKPTDGVAIMQIREGIKALEEERAAIETSIQVKADADKKEIESKKAKSEQKAAIRKADDQKEFEDFLAQKELMRASLLEQDEIDLGLKLEKEDADLQRQILVDELSNNQELMAINKKIANEQDKEKKLALIRQRTKLAKAQEDQLERTRLTNFERFEQGINSRKVQGLQSTLGTISTLQNAENKKLVAIGKAAATANIIISTAQGIMAAFQLGPIVGAVLAPLVATAGAVQLAAVHGVKFAKGGVFKGGVPGVDSIPAIVKQNEIIAPTESFEEVIGSVRAKREADKLGEGTANGNLSLVVNYDSEEASQIVTVRQTEDSALGISQQTFNEAV